MTARRVAELVHDTRHSGPLGDGASRIGEAAGGARLLVRVGVWLDERGKVTRARFRSSSCASLIAYAETACRLLEAGEPPGSLGAERLVAAVLGVHPSHRDRAELVARSLDRAIGVPTDAAGSAP